MLVIDNGDSIRGIAEVATKLDFIVNGYVGVTATQLADGQLGTSEADVYLSSADATVVTSITIVNTDSAARTFTLYLKPSAGTSRAITPVSLDLGIGHSFYTDGQRVVVTDKSGNILSTTTVLPHTLGGSSHDADTLADLNTKISDATLVDIDSITLKALFDANTILAANSDNTPLALSIAASRIVGRKSSGNIGALTAAEIMAILSGQAAATFSFNSQEITSAKLNALVLKGTFTNDGTVVFPAFTLGGTITGGNQTINNLAHIGLGNQAAVANTGLKYDETYAEDLSGAYIGGYFHLRASDTGGAAFGGYAAGLSGIVYVNSANTQNWDGSIGARGLMAAVHTIASGANKVITGMAAFHAAYSVASGASDDTVTNLFGLYIPALSLVGNSRLTNHYGIKIGDIAGGATSNYAIYTGTGIIRFGDALEIGGTLTGVTTLTATNINAFTLKGALTLGENAPITLDAALSADGKYSGTVEAGTAGAVLAFGDLIYQVASDAQWELAKADVAATSDGKLGICVLAAGGGAGNPTTILLWGKVRADTAFPALSVRRPVYISAATAGDITTTAPTGTTNFVVRIIGYANTADELFFCPDNTYVELS